MPTLDPDSPPPPVTPAGRTAQGPRDEFRDAPTTRPEPSAAPHVA
jgi:hypothetical protein